MMASKRKRQIEPWIKAALDRAEARSVMNEALRKRELATYATVALNDAPLALSEDQGRHHAESCDGNPFPQGKDCTKHANRRTIMIVDTLGKAADVFEDIASKRKLDVADVIGVIRDVKARQAEQNDACRSTDIEKETVMSELPKIHPDALSRMNAKQIHAELASRGISVRKNQGVLSVISRARKQLLLSNQPQTEAAE
jgi:hypothetical protein